MNFFQETLQTAKNSVVFPVAMLALWVFSIWKQVRIGSAGPVPTAWVNARTYMRNVK